VCSPFKHQFFGAVSIAPWPASPAAKLEAARADYKTLQQSFTNSFQFRLGPRRNRLRQHETNERLEITNFIWPTRIPTPREATNVIQRLRELKGIHLKRAMRVTHIITRLVVGGAQENTVASVLGLRQKPASKFI